MNPSKVVRVSRDEIDHALSVATAAFVADPFMRYIFSSAPDYLALFGSLVEKFSGAQSLADEMMFRTEGFEGVAIWLKPEEHGDEEAAGAWMQSNVPGDRLPTLVSVVEEMERYRAECEPCWYLSVVGVDAKYQGQGFGSVLMKHVTSQLDDLGITGYLESSNPQNISLYLRHGFEIMGEIQINDSPVVTPMVRQAR
jgi:GNAT superfamily N-acetyltransferase